MTILLIASLTMFTFFTYCAVVAYYQMFKEDFVILMIEFLLLITLSIGVILMIGKVFR